VQGHAMRAWELQADFRSAIELCVRALPELTVRIPLFAALRGAKLFVAAPVFAVNLVALSRDQSTKQF